LRFGEVRGGEAFDLLQLLNTGHSGTISTTHASSAAQGISRFTTCVSQSGIELPYRAIKMNFAESLNVIVQIERQLGRRLASEAVKSKAMIQNGTSATSPLFITEKHHEPHRQERYLLVN
jgi:Flp pilus assembly CpaF family ATPase